MKTMKILSILTIIFGFSQCGSLKFEKNPPFKIISAVAQNWSGGQPGVRGTNININYSSDINIEFDSVYYLNKVVKLENKKSKENKLVVGFFNRSSINRDLILDLDSKKEINNTVPEVKKFPFDLKDNEAVISYKIGDKIKYYKIVSVKKGKSRFTS